VLDRADIFALSNSVFFSTFFKQALKEGGEKYRIRQGKNISSV